LGILLIVATSAGTTLWLYVIRVSSPAMLD
jgi:hypothetical protein